MIHLKTHTILLTRCGSRGYGTSTPTSDIDLKGVLVPPMDYFIGTKSFEQADSPAHFRERWVLDTLSKEEMRLVADGTKIEGTIYGIQKFVRLAADCNPNILDTLFCASKDVLWASGAGALLRANRQAFLSSKAKHTFSGYAHAQLKKIKRHRGYLLNPPTHKPTRAEFDLPDHTLMPADHLAAAEAMVKAALDGWEPDLSMVSSEATRVDVMNKIRNTITEIAAYMQPDANEEVAKWRAAAVKCGLDTEVMMVMERERAYRNKKQEWDSYQSWKIGRNPERAAMEARFGYDLKFAVHTVRLLRMGQEILETGNVNVDRTNIDANELQLIRAGAWKFEDLEEYAKEMDTKLDQLYKSGEVAVPHSPDQNKINGICYEVVSCAKGL